MVNQPSISAEESHVFQCPNCKEFINTSMSACRFCNHPVNYQDALTAASMQEKTGQACNDASYLKIMARTMPVFYLIGWIPFVGAVGSWGFLFLLLAVPIMAVRWLIKYSAVRTEDPDFKRAKRSTMIAMAIWGGMLVIWIIGSIVFSVLSSALASD